MQNLPVANGMAKAQKRQFQDRKTKFPCPTRHGSSKKTEEDLTCLSVNAALGGGRRQAEGGLQRKNAAQWPMAQPPRNERYDQGW